MYKLPSLRSRVHTCVLRMCTHEYAYIVNRLSVRLTLVRAKRTPVQRTVTNDDADKETHDCEPLISTWTYASRTRYQSLCVHYSNKKENLKLFNVNVSFVKIKCQIYFKEMKYIVLLYLAFFIHV